MQDWSSYTLSDFLLFSPRVYERMFVLLNQDIWPAQLLFLAAGIAILVGIVRGHPLAPRLGLAALALGWMLVASVFFGGRYEQINWLGSYIAPIAVLQGASLLAFAVFAGERLQCGRIRPLPASMVASAVLLLGLVAYPLVEAAFGRHLAGTQIVFISPDPTAVATLGLAALLRSHLRWPLMVVPVAWCAFTGLTLWTLGRADFFVAPVAAVLAIVVGLFPRARAN